MTHVSKVTLSQSVQEKLFTQFSTLFTDAPEKQIQNIFSELFTEAEQIMFIKRLAVILMLSEGHSTYKIARVLHVSDSTVGLLRTQYQTGIFDTVLKRTHTKQFDTAGFWKTVDVLLRAGLPPRTKDRWKYVPGMGGKF